MMKSLSTMGIRYKKEQCNVALRGEKVPKHIEDCDLKKLYLMQRI
jgi:hypothetical protein